MYVDAHCHINSLDKERKEIFFKKVNEEFIFIDSSIDYLSSLGSLELSLKFPFVYSSLGFHPFHAESFTPALLNFYREAVGGKKVIGIGEVGLDWKAQAPEDVQIEVLKEFITLARESKLPLFIHNRYHKPLVVEILSEELASWRGVIFHCFSQDVDFLEKIIERGAYVSFSLNVLRENPKILSALNVVPLKSLLLETDAPYMYIKRRPSLPLDIQQLYLFVSRFRNISLEKLQEQIIINIKEIFGLNARDAQGSDFRKPIL